MNVNNARTAEMLFGQLEKIISSDIPEKEEKTRNLGERLATLIEKIADAASTPETLRTHATSLRKATAQPNQNAEVSAIAKAVRPLLQGISQPVKALLEPEQKPRVIEPLFFRNKHIVDILDANSPFALPKEDSMPGLFRQATLLAQRILEGTYGDKVQELLCNALIAPEDVLLLLLLDGVYRKDDLNGIELFTKTSSNNALDCLQALHAHLTPEKITSVILGTQDKNSLPDSDLWLKVVSAAYQTCENEVTKAIVAHMHSFYQPTQTQLLHILLTIDDEKVKADVQRFVEAGDAEVGTKVALLLTALGKEDGQKALSLIRGSTSKAQLEPEFARSLAHVASRRPDFVFSAIESFFSSGDGYSSSSSYSDDEERPAQPLLSPLYRVAMRAAILKIIPNGDLDHAREYIDTIQQPLAQDMARAAFFEAFCSSHPEQALDMLLSRYTHKVSDYTSPHPNEQIEHFIEAKTVKEAFSFWPQVQSYKKAVKTFLSTVLIQAAKGDISEAVAILQNHPDIWESTQAQAAVENLGSYLSDEAKDTSRIRQLLDALPTGHRDSVRAAFLNGCNTSEQLSMQDKLLLLMETNDTHCLSELCSRLFSTYGESKLDLTHKEVVNAILARLSAEKHRDRILSAFALAYARSEKEPEIEEAFSLLSAVSKQSDGEGLWQLAQLLNAIPDASLDTSSKLKHIRRALAEANEMGDDSQVDAIRVSMMEALIKDPSQMSMVLGVMQQINRVEACENALRVVTGALLKNCPEGWFELLQSLVSLANSKEGMECLKSVFWIVTRKDTTLSKQLFECISPEKKDAIRLQMGYQIVSNDASNMPMALGVLQEIEQAEVYAEALGKLAETILSFRPEGWLELLQSLVVLANDREGVECLKAVFGAIANAEKKLSKKGVAEKLLESVSLEKADVVKAAICAVQTASKTHTLSSSHSGSESS